MKSIGNNIFWKLTASVVWTVILEAVLLILTVFLDINIFSPATWLQALYTAISFRLWLCFLPLAAVTVAQGMICGNKYLSVPDCSRTRFESIRNIFTGHNVIMVMVYPLMSSCIVWTFLSAVGREHLNVDGLCENSHNCISEKYAYLTLGGLWSGIHFFLTTSIFNNNNLLFPVQFPVVQQLKYIQVKSELLPSLKQAMHKAIWPNLYFLVLFYWKSDFLCALFGLSMERTGLNIFIILHSWLCSTIFIFTVLITRCLLQVYLTEYWEFPIVPKSEGYEKLHEVLSMKDHPMVQTLGCYDLLIVSERDVCRRLELFDLSQPGGHSHNWNALIKEILVLIESFTSDLDAATFEIGVAPNLFKSNIVVNPVASPAPVRCSHALSMHDASMKIQSSPGIRNLSLQREAIHETLAKQSTLSEHFNDFVKKRAVILADSIMKQPVIHFLFGEIPEARVRCVLTRGLPVVWASQAVASIVANAVKEDKYGVVLKDLPAVISSLVNLKLVLDKISKLGSFKRFQRNEQDEVKIQIALKSSIKRGLYRICSAYGESVLNTEVPVNIKSQLQMFLTLRE